MKNPFKTMLGKFGPGASTRKNPTRSEVSITKPPAVNVLSESAFRERAVAIFTIMDEILGRSYGPFGAPTLISDYPFVHATKDGYTIARYVSLDHNAGSIIDRVIMQMALDICGRLNYAVGDGTTTAVLATNQMFTFAIDLMNTIAASPRQFIQLLKNVKETIIENLEKETVHITEDTLVDTIRKITRIASNDDVEISDMITAVYDEFRYPVVMCDTSDGPKTYLDIQNGYKCKVRLGDAVYINTDRKTGVYLHPKVLIFDHKIRVTTYQEIIYPLYTIFRSTNTPLIIVAPSYDEKALHNHIKRDVMTEFRSEKTVSLIITAFPNNNKTDITAMYDLASLMDTTVIDPSIEEQILDGLSNAPVVGVDKYSRLSCLVNLRPATDTTQPIINIGHADKFTGGTKESVFVISDYDETLYQKILEDAKHQMDEITRKYEILGSYTADVTDAKYRYTSLLMKTAVIHVGGDSSLSRDMRADSVEDAIRAAESAFHNGYVLGGNISLLRAIKETVYSSEEEYQIGAAFYKAFRSVFSRVFDNANITDSDLVSNIINTCVDTNSTYDITTGDYSKDIINSVKTDIEVLTATVDLLSILLTGNQMLVARYQHPTSEN